MRPMAAMQWPNPQLSPTNKEHIDLMEEETNEEMEMGTG